MDGRSEFRRYNKKITLIKNYRIQEIVEKHDR